MLTAILPIRIDTNDFWSSSQGLECIENFLKTCAQTPVIDKFVVITADDRVSRLAGRKGMEVSSRSIPGSIDRPYTVEQTLILAKSLGNYCPDRSDALIIVDNRSLLLTVDDLFRAHRIYQQNTEAGMISLAFCKDYPCQFKSYFLFLGCSVIQFDALGMNNNVEKSLQVDFPFKSSRQINRDAEITSRVYGNSSGRRVAFYSKNLPAQGFIIQIIPFNQNGPLYDKSIELEVKTAEYETALRPEESQLTGIICIFKMLSQTGSFDTVEFFTTENTPWELGESVSTVISKEKHEPMYSRQQFPPTYTYDGSLCILSPNTLSEEVKFNPCSFIVEESCIVTDWVDYLYTVNKL